MTLSCHCRDQSYGGRSTAGQAGAEGNTKCADRWAPGNLTLQQRLVLAEIRGGRPEPEKREGGLRAGPHPPHPHTTELRRHRTLNGVEAVEDYGSAGDLNESNPYRLIWLSTWSSVWEGLGDELPWPVALLQQ